MGTLQKVALIEKKSANVQAVEKAAAMRRSDVAEKFQMFQSEKTTNNAVEKRPTMISVANAATLKVAKFWQKGPAEKSSAKSVQSTNSKYFCKEMNKKRPKNSASIKRRL